MSETPTIVFVPHEATKTEYVTRTVHEHRAPTDQSVALLKDMEAAARDKIIESVKIGDTTFECVVHKYIDNMSDQTVWLAVFSLNGKKQQAEARISRRDTNVADALRKLRDEIAVVIATSMISSSLASIPKY